jgi:hypothetical protein
MLDPAWQQPDASWLTPRQVRLLARLEPRAPRASDLLRRGYDELARQDGLSWRCFVGHAFREAMNRLPGELAPADEGDRTHVRYGDLVETVAALWPEGGVVPEPLPAELVDAIDTLVREHRQLSGRLLDRATDLVGSLRRGAGLSTEDARRHAVLWRRLQMVFHGLAHLREESAELVPVDEVERAVALFEDLVGALDSEPFYEITGELERLAALEAPTAAERDRVRVLLASPQLVGAFLAVASPGWLEPLEAAGVLAVDGAAASLHPGLGYLVRVAAERPDAVLGVMERHAKDLDDNARSGMLDAAVRMPAALAARVARLAQRHWLGATENPYVLGARAAALAHCLVDEGDAETALRLVRTLVSVRHDVTEVDGFEEFEGLSRMVTLTPNYFDPWGLRRFLDGTVARVRVSLPGPTLDVLVNQVRWALHEAVNLGGHDSSWVSRPAIEPHEQNTPLDDAREALIDAIRDSAELIAATDPDRVLALLDDEQPILRRIALHVLRVSDAPALVSAARAVLVDRAAFDDVESHHEYALLLAASFGKLVPEDQATILGFIDDGPAYDNETWSDEDRTRYGEHWQRDRLSLIADALPPGWDARYADLVARRGEADHPEFQSYMTSFSGPTSPIESDALAALGDDELLEFLQTWTAPDGFGEPSEDGLARTTSQVVAADPERFARLAAGAAELPARQLRAVLHGLDEAVRAQRSIGEWTGVVSLLEHALTGDRDMRQGAAWLLRTAVHAQAIPIEHRERVWGLLLDLAADPDPTPEREASWGPAGGIELNSIRPVALDAACDYAAWVLTNKAADRVPELREVLDRALGAADADGTVLGGRFANLFAIDREWAESSADALFASAAAWNGYVTRNRVYADVVALLGDHYERAVDDLAQEQELTRAHQALISHVMTMHWSGLDAALAERFFSVAGAAHRVWAVRSVTRALRNTDAEEQPIAQLDALWRARLEQLEPGDPEACEYGGWFTHAALAPDDAFSLLIATLDLADNHLTNAEEVLERVAQLAGEHPAAALAVLERVLTEAGERAWSIQAPARAVLTALLAGDEPTTEGARSVIHDLGERGIHFARDLLRPTDV